MPFERPAFVGNGSILAVRIFRELTNSDAFLAFCDTGVRFRQVRPHTGPSPRPAPAARPGPPVRGHPTIRRRIAALVGAGRHPHRNPRQGIRGCRAAADACTASARIVRATEAPTARLQCSGFGRAP
ncbi:hypothetical protein FNF07_26775 [Trinickia caryophylli]|nr:hypothetical protein FNF07_26775 [Trinickia caryophylli]